MLEDVCILCLYPLSASWKNQKGFAKTVPGGAESPLTTSETAAGAPSPSATPDGRLGWPALAPFEKWHLAHFFSRQLSEQKCSNCL